MNAVHRMKQTLPTAIDVEWCCDWQQRESNLSGFSFWVRRGSFDSPVAALLPAEARRSTVWEIRGSPPPASHRGCEPAVLDRGLLLPTKTKWFGLEPLDRCLDALVHQLNFQQRLPHAPLPEAGQGAAILILPDFGGEFCKRTFPVAELVAAKLPQATVVLLEMPHRGTRKAPGYIGAVMNTVQDMIVMGCATIEEGRAIMEYMQRCGHQNLTIAGVSMGGHMAALTAACSREALRLALLLPSHSAEANWIDGGLMGIIQMKLPPESIRAILSESTNVYNYPACRNVEQAVIVAARHDGYVPYWSSLELAHWLEKQDVSTELRFIEGGHVSSFLAHHVDFANAIVDITSTVHST